MKLECPSSRTWHFHKIFFFDRSCFLRAYANYVTDRLSCWAYSALFISVCKVRKIQFHWATKILAGYQVNVIFMWHKSRETVMCYCSPWFRVGHDDFTFFFHFSTVLTIYVPSLLSSFIKVCKVSTYAKVKFHRVTMYWKSNSCTKTYCLKSRETVVC